MTETKEYNNALIGFRSWKINELHNLESIGLGRTSWHPGENVALCRSKSFHHAPVSSCHCGLYAYKEFEATQTRWRSSSVDIFVSGAVIARGRVEIHPTGFRAQYMSVLSLYNPTQDPLVKRIAEFYNIPDFKTIKEFNSYNNQFQLVQLESEPFNESAESAQIKSALKRYYKNSQVVKQYHDLTKYTLPRRPQLDFSKQMPDLQFFQSSHKEYLRAHREYVKRSSDYRHQSRQMRDTTNKKLEKIRNEIKTDRVKPKESSESASPRAVLITGVFIIILLLLFFIV